MYWPRNRRQVGLASAANRPLMVFLVGEVTVTHPVPERCPAGFLAVGAGGVAFAVVVAVMQMYVDVLHHRITHAARQRQQGFGNPVHERAGEHLAVSVQMHDADAEGIVRQYQPDPDRHVQPQRFEHTEFQKIQCQIKQHDVQKRKQIRAVLELAIVFKETFGALQPGLRRTIQISAGILAGRSCHSVCHGGHACESKLKS